MKHLITKKPLLVALSLAIAAPALAQSAGDPALDTRIRKLEAEVSALQRVVFPGGDGRFFPQMQPSQPGTSPVGTPASNPNADMLTRMDGLEGQVSRLTAQVEEDRNRLDKLEARLAALESAKTEAPAPAATSSTGSNLSAMTGGASNPVPVATTTPKPAATAPVAKPADPSAKRLAAVRAIAKPETSDPGDDEYSYGFRLWEAKFQPEAQQQLKLFLGKYPKHARVSYARNLLGRSYLDEGNPREAASWFLQNYKADPKGDRAPDSVLYLAESMRQMKDTNRACVALEQFAREFPKEAAGRLKTQYDATRGGLKCPA
ncbi:MAG: tetratricopeptide repeat protein [Novosphingobium sp.]